MGEALEGPDICTCMSSGDTIGAGLFCTAAILVDMGMIAVDDRGQGVICHLVIQLFDSVIALPVPGSSHLNATS